MYEVAHGNPFDHFCTKCAEAAQELRGQCLLGDGVLVPGQIHE